MKTNMNITVSLNDAELLKKVTCQSGTQSEKTSASDGVKQIIKEFHPSPEEILAQIETNRVTTYLELGDLVEIDRMATATGKKAPLVMRAWIELYAKKAANGPWGGEERRT